MTDYDEVYFQDKNNEAKNEMENNLKDLQEIEKNERKRHRRQRTTFTPFQLYELEMAFSRSQYLDGLNR